MINSDENTFAYIHEKNDVKAEKKKERNGIKKILQSF